MNSLCVKVIMGQFKSLKQIFFKFQGQFDLGGQGHKSMKILQDLYMINTQFKFEIKIDYGSKVVAFTRNYTIFKANLTLTVKDKVTRFQTYLRYLVDQ